MTPPLIPYILFKINHNSKVPLYLKEVFYMLFEAKSLMNHILLIYNSLKQDLFTFIHADSNALISCQISQIISHWKYFE